jgi:hypothetical protein
VDREVMRQLLCIYGVPELLVRAIMDLYHQTRAFVMTADGPTDEFPTSSGVLQGDTLAPVLFILVMDYVLRQCIRDDDSFVISRRRSSRHPEVVLAALAYADDVAATTPRELDCR